MSQKICAIYTGDESKLNVIPMLFDNAEDYIRLTMTAAGCHDYFRASEDFDLEGYDRFVVLTRPAYISPDMLNHILSKGEEDAVFLDGGPGLFILNSVEGVKKLLAGSPPQITSASTGNFLLDLENPVSRHLAQERANAVCVRGHMERGVIFIDPNTAYISLKTEIAAGTVIYPQTIIKGDSKIGANCQIGPNTMITSSEIDDNSTVNASQIIESKTGREANIGPFAYLRPGTILADSVKVGDFSEIKNSVIGEGTKIPHLSYVGDATVGAGVNFGCGSIVANYDGKIKPRSIVEDGVFLGSNTILVSPVTVGRGAYTAAGSTITADVPPGDLAIARSKQVNKAGWADRRRGTGK